MRHIFGLAALLVVLLVLVRGFFGSLWRAPPKPDDYQATDWGSSYGANDSHNPGSPHDGSP